jgi:hypothetical protein
MDCKYNTASPNILCCLQNSGSPFWKGVMWAIQTAKIGYTWKVGNGKKFDFGKTSGKVIPIWLAIQYRNLYTIVNEKGKTIAQVWNAEELMLTFKRTIIMNGLRLLQLQNL